MIWAWISAYFRQWAGEEDRSTMRKKGRQNFLQMALLLGDDSVDESDYPKHRHHDARVSEANRNLKHVSFLERVAFGDSILEFLKRFLSALLPSGNFALAGSWSHQIKQMMLALRKLLGTKKIRIVYFGCMAGNPLIAHQPIDAVLRELKECMDTAREVFPNAKIVIYGIPPVGEIYVMTHRKTVNRAIYDWVLNDGNAVFVDLQKGFAGFLGLFPKARISSDGIHLSPIGGRKFDVLLNMAAEAQPGTRLEYTWRLAWAGFLKSIGFRKASRGAA